MLIRLRVSVKSRLAVALFLGFDFLWADAEVAGEASAVPMAERQREADDCARPPVGYGYRLAVAKETITYCV